MSSLDQTMNPDFNNLSHQYLLWFYKLFETVINLFWTKRKLFSFSPAQKWEILVETGFVDFVLSNLWIWILNFDICCYFAGRHSGKNQNKYLKFDTSTSLMSCRGYLQPKIQQTKMLVMLHVKSLVICLYLDWLGWSGSILQLRQNMIKVGSKSCLLTCSSNVTLSLPIHWICFEERVKFL